MSNGPNYFTANDGLGGGGLPTLYAWGGAGGNLYFDRTNPLNEHWAPVPTSAPAAAPTVTPVAAAPPAPPHLQFSSNTIGTTTFLSYGRGRLPGQIIWAAGLDASSDTLTTSLLTFCTSYCEPIDPFESIRIQRMWCNGTLFFDFGQGGLLNVAILSEDDQFALKNCIDKIEFHEGGPGELPSPVMETFLDAGNVPAYRGLRTIVFSDFPLILANNSVPNISVEFRRTDVTLIDVSVVLSKFIAHYMEKVGLQSTDSTAPGYFTYEIDGIDDQCYGLTITDQSTLIDKLVQYRNIYKYQITDGRPVKLIRRPVNSGLVIDYPDVLESELMRTNGVAAVNFARANPVDLPVGLDLQYLDIDNNFDSSVSQSRHEGSGTSNTIASLSSDFIIDNTTARQLSFEILYQNRAEGLHITFEMDDLTPEVSDVIEITTTNGDTFICRVESQTQTKTRSSGITALNLLTVAGSDINGDIYRDGGANVRRLWPEQAIDWDLIISGGTVYGIYDFTISMNSLVGGVRKLTPTRFRDMSDKDPLGLNWGGSDFWRASGGPGPMFEDNTYVYWLENSTMVISRLLKAATDINFVETITIADGFFVDGINDNINQQGNVAQFKDGKLYVAWQGQWGGVAHQMKLVVVDIVAWSDTAFNVYDFSTDVSDYPIPYGIVVTDNGTILISTQKIVSLALTGRYYYASVSSPSSWSTFDSTVVLGNSVSSGNIAYVLEGDNSVGVSHRKHHVSVVDCSSTPSESVIDLTSQDANVVSISQMNGNLRPFIANSHLFIACNYTVNNHTDQNEHPYLGRFDLVTLTAAGGKFLSQFVYAEHELAVRYGRFAAGKLYLLMNSVLYSNQGRLIIINDDLTSPELLPAAGVTAPLNDNFADAININLTEIKTGNLFYGSTETGEPVPSWAVSGSDAWVGNNGHSVWYSFVAPAATTYTITATSSNVSIQVYTGSAVGSLSSVVQAAAGSFPNTASFLAVASVVYMISLRYDGLADAGGTQLPFEARGAFTITIN